MNPVFLILFALILFAFGYAVYGKKIEKLLGIKPERKTPAFTKYDGVDYVPAKSPVLLGHHFASIAGAGPILGPIYAAVFGWIPVFLWIVIAR